MVANTFKTISKMLLVVFHLLNRLIKGVIGSVLSAPRFPSPPFHYLPSIQVFLTLGAFSPPHFISCTALQSCFSPPQPSTPIFCVHIFPFSHHFVMRNYTSSFIAEFCFQQGLSLVLLCQVLGIFLLLYS